MYRLGKILIILLLLCPRAFAQAQQDVVPDTVDIKTAIPAFNDEIRKTSRRLRALENGVSLSSGVTGILPTANGGTGFDASAVAAGEILYFSSLGVISHEPLPSHVQIFTSSGTFTAGSNITKVYLTMVGGGASGAAKDAGQGGGGGAGQWIINYPYTVVGGNNYTVTVGAGGTGVIGSNDGNDGGTTTFDALSVSGGAKGLSAGTGGAGGGISLNASGSTGGSIGGIGGNGANGAANVGGGGGGTPFGAGTDGKGVGVSSSSATANTGAGSGGTGSAAGANSSGNGGSGFVIVLY